MWSLLKLLIVPAVEFVHRVELIFPFLTLVTTVFGSHLSLFVPLVLLLLLLPLSHFSHVRLCATHRRQPTRLPHPWEWVAISFSNA